MISSKHDDIFGCCQFHQHEYAHDFNGHDASIDIISEKDKSCFSSGGIGDEEVNMPLRIDFLLWEQREYLNQIKELAMYISNNNNWIINFDNVGFGFYKYVVNK